MKNNIDRGTNNSALNYVYGGSQNSINPKDHPVVEEYKEAAKTLDQLKTTLYQFIEEISPVMSDNWDSEGEGTSKFATQSCEVERWFHVIQIKAQDMLDALKEAHTRLRL
jgi:hypothetical protein